MRLPVPGFRSRSMGVSLAVRSRVWDSVRPISVQALRFCDAIYRLSQSSWGKPRGGLVSGVAHREVTVLPCHLRLNSQFIRHDQTRSQHRSRRDAAPGPLSRDAGRQTQARSSWAALAAGRRELKASCTSVSTETYSDQRHSRPAGKIGTKLTSK
jgi:hypothetical protein